ncbi:MAG TPA: hypothetical protein VFD43_12555 [Planctomycetota bacterium]|nr:hypothetical protein [Planctomycetota bacterium]
MHRALLLLPFALPLPAAAQEGEGPIVDPVTEVSVTGFVTPLPVLDAASALCIAPTHQLECPEDTVFLWSNKVDLGALLGQNVKLRGMLASDCGIVAVESIESPPATLTACGSPQLGCPIRLRSGPGGLTQHWLFVALAGGFLPLNPEKGSLLLGEPLFLIGSSGAGQFGDTGAAFDFNMPSNPVLVGLQLNFQAASRKVGPVGPIHFSNSVCMDVFGFVGMLCVEPDC